MKQVNKLQSSNQKITTIVKLGNSKLMYKIPMKWSINKLKCLLTTEIPSLSFDEFEIGFKEQLLRGTHKLGEIVKNNENEEQIEVEIIKTKSQIRFKEYYKNCMQNFMKISSYNNQPVLNTDYQKYINLVTPQPKQNQNNPNIIQNQNIEEINRQINDVQNPMHPLLRILKLLGIYLILILVYDHGKAHQIAIILSIVLTYYGIEQYVKYRQRKMKMKNNNRRNAQARVNNPVQNNEDKNGELYQEQKKEEELSKWKGLIKLRIYQFVQVIFCFLFTFFPNLTIEMHLQINKERIERARNQINRLIPDTFPSENRINQNV